METRVNLSAGAEAERIVEEVRERYGRIAEGTQSGCCGPKGCATPEADVAVGIGYRPDDLAEVDEANLGLGCGAPVELLGLRSGETVLDLGSGPGLDAVLAARKVGSSGRVIGVDMTPAMLVRARATAERRGLAHVEFREGRLEALPVEDGSVDAVTSNCVINLVPDKAAVFREVARVLRPGGRLVVSDIILDAPLPEALAKDILAYVGCVAGAALRADYFDVLKAAGLGSVEVLRDVDYIATLAEAAPEAVREFEDRTDVSAASLTGRVRSITYRAVKPA